MSNIKRTNILTPDRPGIRTLRRLNVKSTESEMKPSLSCGPHNKWTHCYIYSAHKNLQPRNYRLRQQQNSHAPLLLLSAWICLYGSLHHWSRTRFASAPLLPCCPFPYGQGRSTRLKKKQFLKMSVDGSKFCSWGKLKDRWGFAVLPFLCSLGDVRPPGEPLASS